MEPILPDRIFDLSKAPVMVANCWAGHTPPPINPAGRTRSTYLVCGFGRSASYGFALDMSLRNVGLPSFEEDA